MRGTALALLIQVAAPQASTSAPDVVVLSQRVDDARRDLKACIARNCPPTEDVAASLTLAEAQFTTGAYDDARGTLRASLSRNGRVRRTQPALVAGLWRADSRIAIHLGDTNGYRTSQFAALKVMKDAHGDEGNRDVLIEQLELASVDEHLGRVAMAHQTYAAVAKRAERAGARDLQGFAMFYDAQMYARRAIADGFYATTAKRSIAALMQTTAPELAAFREAASRLELRMKARSDEPAAVARLVDAYGDEKV